LGEEARRSGTDFERSISGMLTRLGYEIVLENESINCQKEEHHQKTHGIDFLARPGKQLVRKPVNAPDAILETSMNV